MVAVAKMRNFKYEFIYIPVKMNDPNNPNNPINPNKISDLKKIFDQSYEKFDPSYKQNYYKKYGIDFIIMMITVLLFIILILYYYLLNIAPAILAKWPQNKCNPKYMQFAHLINPDKHKTTMEQSGELFEYCVKDSLIPVAEDAFKPVYYSLDVLTKSYDELAKSMTNIKGDFSHVRSDVTDITKNINSKAVDVNINQNKEIITIKNMMQILQSGIVGSLYVQKYILQSFLDIFR